MASWPTTDDLKQYVDVEGTEDWNAELESSIDAGIERVKSDVGGRDEDGNLNWDDDVDEPDERLRLAALRAAIVLRVNRGDSASLETDGQYLGYLRGHRREFGIA